MSEATEVSVPSGSPSDAPAAIVSISEQDNVRDILAVADKILSLERKPEKSEADEALEWHEVIELQAFIERKAWIEEKIKFLEQLPPIEVFVGLDAVRTSAIEVPGLPTREQLETWMVEHDKIEKETELFDSGELKKLKKFTKAAAQRNLSPADTDLIEITLTTIYLFDKLLHLLRDRLDNLNLLGVRLTWEERRTGAWKELRSLLGDTRDFLGTRARWSPAVYENIETDEAAPEERTPKKRRGSIVSMTSEASHASMPGYSRGARYKLAETLSQEAAQLASRTSLLRHTRIAAAGKALDKLIDDSRRPVPDELLDEQDKLENEGITEMEDIGKFLMQMVMQWKKADEFYVDTLKDKSDAQTLLEEIEVAKLNHPTARQDVNFMSRASALIKRLMLRGNPTYSPMFPKPEHLHFPEQNACTDAVTQELSSEAALALQQVEKADTCAKEYHASLKEWLERERLDKEKHEQLERERLEKERHEQLERERLEKEKEINEQLEKERVETEERALLERKRAEAEEREQREQRDAAEHAALEEMEKRNLRLARDTAIIDNPLETVEELSFSIDDIFSIRTTTSGLSPEMSELSSRIFSFRKRLRSIGINDAARPSLRSNAELPTDDARKAIVQAFSLLTKEVLQLPRLVLDEPVVNADLRSLRSEMEASKELLARVNQLADFNIMLKDCDEALSDLLEHIDSYPAPPIGSLATLHRSNTALTPEEQLSSRLIFTRDVLSHMKILARTLSDDRRVPIEHERVLQTWSELEAMALDRINGQKSRPSSVISSGRSSRASVMKSSTNSNKPTDSPRIRASLDVPRPRHSLDKKGSYSKLSASPKFLVPASSNLNARRAASGSSVSTTAQTRSSSRMSIASSVRSVSGPMSASSSGGSLYGSTFSSRQRTNSTTSNSSLATPPVQRRPAPSTGSAYRPRAQTGATRASSPAYSDAGRSTGRSSLNLPRPSTTTHSHSLSQSTWGRSPRLSFPTAHKSPPSRLPTAKPRKPYVANPKNKLDVAIGDVVNKLPVDIKIELVADTWKDQSGKYWIGDTEPKLCFCRILRSQTVMVRVGGGWQELSKFIKDHFADAFRLLQDTSPPRLATREEKWISSSTLAQASETWSPTVPPKTPEPQGPYLPSFAISTPSGKSPQSLKTTPSPGSPLHALQFIRRAEMADLSYRPETPTRGTRNGTASVLNSPARHHPHSQPAWRP